MFSDPLTYGKSLNKPLAPSVCPAYHNLHFIVHLCPLASWVQKITSSNFVIHTIHFLTFHIFTNYNTLKHHKTHFILGTSSYVFQHQGASDNLKYMLDLLSVVFNPLNPELNPICHLLALLGAHHFLHVSRIRVKLLTL